ncbi:MAG: NUDIX hydrolase [Eubacterium sp.]|nr:NUDIX hydrolase [Eubacterium sp.]
MTNDDKSLAWEEIRTEHIVQDKWIDFRRSAYRFPDGREFEPFYSYSRRDYCVIVASDEDGNYLCVRQFRQGIGEVTTEFPAGGIERSDGREYIGRSHSRQDSYSEQACLSDQNGHPGQACYPERNEGSKTSAEDALTAAKRELLEETGYESDEWTHMLTIPSNATIADNYAHLFIAKNCRKVAGQSLDETECLNVTTHTAEEIDRLIFEGDFKQAMHVTAWLLSKNHE